MLLVGFRHKMISHISLNSSEYATLLCIVNRLFAYLPGAKIPRSHASHIETAIDAGRIVTLEYTYCKLIDHKHCASITGIIGKLVNVYTRCERYYCNILLSWYSRTMGMQICARFGRSCIRDVKTRKYKLKNSSSGLLRKKKYDNVVHVSTHTHYKEIWAKGRPADDINWSDYQYASERAKHTYTMSHISVEAGSSCVEGSTLILQLTLCR